MCKWVYANEGHGFIVTEKAPPHVKSKYPNYMQQGQGNRYFKAVPLEWIQEGWAEDVKEKYDV